MQKRIICVIFNVNPKMSCRGLFRRLNILPFYSLYMYSLLLLVAKNASKLVINYKIYAIDALQSNNLCLPSVSLSKCKKGAYFMSIKIFNHLPQYTMLINLKCLLRNFFKGIFLFNQGILRVV
jgi:hypothetical protein